MVRVSLPREIELHCPECRGKFKTTTRSLSKRATVNCPYCACEFSVYDALNGLLRRQVYHAIRDELERRVYEQKHMEQPGYFEDKANIE